MEGEGRDRNYVNTVVIYESIKEIIIKKRGRVLHKAPATTATILSRICFTLISRLCLDMF